MKAEEEFEKVMPDSNDFTFESEPIDIAPIDSGRTRSRGASREFTNEELMAWRRLGNIRNLDEFRGLKPLLTPELARCFSPQVHENQICPYGALIARDDDVDKFGQLEDINDEEQLRNAADGKSTLRYSTKDKSRQLLRLKRPLNSQDECSALASWVNGVVVRVSSNHVIWVASGDFVTTIDTKAGWNRPSTIQIVSELMQLVPDTDRDALSAIAKLAYARFSPEKIGTTLLYSLAEDRADHQSAGTPMRNRNLNAKNLADWPLIEHELKHTDGAAVFERGGLLLRKSVMLDPTPQSTAIRTERGARHTSACRHTFDRSDILAFVVSADGPVTVFSDGVPSRSLILSEQEMPWNPSGGEMWAAEQECPNCRVRLLIRRVILYGFREREEAFCPICRAEAASVHGWHIEAGLIKDAPSIQRISEFRERMKNVRR